MKTVPPVLAAALVLFATPIVALAGEAMARDLLNGRITAEQLSLPEVAKHFPNAATAWSEWQGTH